MKPSPSDGGVQSGGRDIKCNPHSVIGQAVFSRGDGRDIKCKGAKMVALPAASEPLASVPGAAGASDTECSRFSEVIPRRQWFFNFPIGEVRDSKIEK